MKHNDKNHDHLSNSSDDSDASRTPPSSADDPRLTAYAIGEMDAAERAAYETEIRDDPAAQSAIAEIRSITGRLEAAFTAEPAPETAAPPDGDWRAAREAEALAARKRARANKPFRFPYFLIAGLATACFALIFFTIIKPDYERKELQRKQAALEMAAATGTIVIDGKTYVADAFPAQAKPAEGESRSLATPPAIVFPAPRTQPLPNRPEASQPPRNRTVVAAKSMPSAPRTMTWGRNVYPSDAPNTESYAAHTDNTFQSVAQTPLSTFSADIDTASYTNIRRFLNSGRLPPRDAVRIEEMVNYFNYDYAPPAKDSAAPFAATMEVAAAPWNPEHRLVRIGIKGREVSDSTRSPANLVFLLDISGSMDAPNRLPLVKESMRMLINRLRADDRIAIVTYANTIDLALPSTPVADKARILDTLDALRATGGTNGGKGIQLAYEVAKANYLKDGANRVILCTDGDFNIGITNRDELTSLIAEKAKTGVFLTVLGFGMGNLKDSTLQLLADKGNGNHGYIDTRDEARRLLVEQTAGTLVTIAKDVKLQVEFNPAQAASYRLLGYEKRLLAKEDFNNDKVDAGEIGAGHTVTALYEVIPAAVAQAAKRPSDIPAVTVDALKYQTQTTVTTAPKLELKGELLTLKIRYKTPSSDMSDKVEFVLEDKGAGFAEASPDFKFTCSIAAFGMLLRDSPDKGLATYDRVLGWAEAGMGDAAGADHTRRGEFTDLVRRARQIGTN